MAVPDAMDHPVDDRDGMARRLMEITSGGTAGKERRQEWIALPGTRVERFGRAEERQPKLTAGPGDTR